MNCSPGSPADRERREDIESARRKLAAADIEIADLTDDRLAKSIEEASRRIASIDRRDAATMTRLGLIDFLLIGAGVLGIPPLE